MDVALKKRPLKQRRPLLVSELQHLEDVCINGTDNHNRVFCRYFPFLVYGRARNSDTALVTDMVLDQDEHGGWFIQVSATSTKTSRTLAKRSRFLHLVAPIRGLATSSWALSWLEAREESGLGHPMSDAVPLMPAPLLDGKWSDRPLSARETKKWLTEILLNHDNDTELDHLGSHVGKVTLLAWMSKIGANTVTRRYLGYHVESNDNSMLTYSRDAASGPLRELENMISAVRCLAFFPDSTRSGYMSRELRVLGFDAWYEGAVLSRGSNCLASGPPDSGPAQREDSRDDSSSEGSSSDESAS